jgi:hypothetical protein
MIANLPTGAVNTLLAAMETIQGVLAKDSTKPDYILRRDRVGDMGLVASRQALIYEQEYGWDKTYEALAAKILNEFVGRNDTVNERLDSREPRRHPGQRIPDEGRRGNRKAAAALRGAPRSRIRPWQEAGVGMHGVCAASRLQTHSAVDAKHTFGGAQALSE